MFGRTITWYICIFIAVVTAADYTDQDIMAGSDHEVAVNSSATDSQVPDVEETTAVELSALLDAGDGAVVVVVAGATRLAAHRAVLSARSPALAAMLRRDTPESGSGVLTVPDVEGPVLRQLLAYCYTLQAPHLPATAPHLLAAADRYGLPDLKAACEQQVAAQLTVENAAATALLALKHSCPSLRQAAVAFIKAHTQQVVMTQGWADAALGQPHSVLELTRLIAGPPADNSVPMTTAGETSSITDHQPHSNHGQPTDAAAPHTDPCHTPTPDEATISNMQNLSREDKGRRLIKAAMVGAVQELQALLAAGTDVEARDTAWDDWTALHWAADRGHLQAVRCLLEGGADVAARTSQLNTALHLAAWSGHAAVVRHLVGTGVDPNIRGKDRKTPLHLTAQWGNTEVAFALIDAGADRDARDEHRGTPLNDAVWASKQNQMVQILSSR